MRIKRIISALIILTISGIMLFSENGIGGASIMEYKIAEQVSQVTKEMATENLLQSTEEDKEASGQLEEVEVINLPEMEWVLFLETEVSYGAAPYSYFRYGIYGDFTKERKTGEEVYFALHDSVFEKIPELALHINWKEINEEYKNHEKWIMSAEEIIVDCSTNMDWIITREQGTERWYKKGEKVNEFETKSYDMEMFIQHGEVSSSEPLEGEIILKAQDTLENLYKMQYGQYYRSWSCFSNSGKALAAVNKISWEKPDGINIYFWDGKDVVLLYELAVPNNKAGWPIEISQMEGNQSSGWVVFSYGKETFRMTYPEGKIEKLGEYMYSTSYSPDGKYIAYCTGNRDLNDHWMYLSESEHQVYYAPMKEEWEKIPQGWYVIEVETGEKSYIPVPYWKYDADRPLYGGRCTWIEKDKLMELLEME